MSFIPEFQVLLSKYESVDALLTEYLHDCLCLWEAHMAHAKKWCALEPSPSTPATQQEENPDTGYPVYFARTPGTFAREALLRTDE